MTSMANKDTAAFNWGQAAGIVLLILAALYAVQHPGSFVYYLVKLIALPIP